MTRLASRPGAALVAAILAAGCGHAPKPVRFAESTTFHTMSGRVHGILQIDVNGDGHEDAALAERRDDGYVVTLLRQDAADAAAPWKPVCASDPIPGEDLDALRLVHFGAGPTVFVLVLTENPEEVRQELAIIDLAGGCKAVFDDQIDLERPDPEVVLAPAGLKGGARMSADGTRLTIYDEPEYLHLTGASGEVRVLTSVRERVVAMRDGAVAVAERTLPVLGAARLTARSSPAGEPVPAPTPVAAAPATDSAGVTAAAAATPVLAATSHAAGAAGREIPELVDGDDATRTVAAPGEDERVELASDRPLVLLELHSGCGTAGAPALTLGAEGAVVTLGERPPAQGFVRATGLGSETAGMRKDLVALRGAPSGLALDVGPKETQRCLRELKGYGFAAEGGPAGDAPGP